MEIWMVTVDVTYNLPPETLVRYGFFIFNISLFFFYLSTILPNANGPLYFILAFAFGLLALVIFPYFTVCIQWERDDACERAAIQATNLRLLSGG